jgi:hypothetical protein
MKRLLLALCLTSSLAACGGDDALSTSEYRGEARKICQEADRATSAVERPTRTTNAAIASYFERLMNVNRKTSEQFGELEPPEELKAKHEAALAANRDGVKEVERLVAELRRGGDARALLQAAQGRLQQLSQRSAEAARALGVPECAQQE